MDGGLIRAASALLLWGAVGAQAEPGGATGNILKFPLSPRAAAMGDAFAAVSAGVDSLGSNPAGLADAASHELKAMHVRLPLGMRQQDLAYGASTRWGAMAVSYMSFDSGRVDAYDASDRRLDAVRAEDSLARLAYARRVGPAAVGVSLARLREELAGVAASTALADVGLQARYGGVSAGLAVRNLGRGLRFDSDRDPLPRILSLGGAVERRLGGLLSLLGGAEMTKSSDRSGVQARVGAELRVRDAIALRLGYLTEQDSGLGLRAGLGLGFRGVSLDYALARMGELGDAHRLSISMRWMRAAAPKPPRPAAEDASSKASVPPAEDARPKESVPPVEDARPKASILPANSIISLSVIGREVSILTAVPAAYAIQASDANRLLIVELPGVAVDEVRRVLPPLGSALLEARAEPGPSDGSGGGRVALEFRETVKFTVKSEGARLVIGWEPSPEAGGRR